MTQMRRTERTLQVLDFLARAEGDVHGWTITRESGIPGGVVYPILNRLVDRGLAIDSWDDENPESASRPRRHLYRLTEAGRDLYQEWNSR